MSNTGLRIQTQSPALVGITAALRQVFSTLFEGDAIVLVVNPENEIIDYRVQPMDEVIADLALSGLGQPLEPNP